MLRMQSWNPKRAHWRQRMAMLLLMPMDLVSAIIRHVARAITCRHDGLGLPSTPRAATFWLLFALAIVAVAFKLSTRGSASYDVIAACVVFGLSAIGITVFAGSAMLAVAPVYFCSALGLDIIQALAALVGHEIPGPIPAIWQWACVISAFAKVSRRVEAEKRS